MPEIILWRLGLITSSGWSERWAFSLEPTIRDYRGNMSDDEIAQLADRQRAVFRRLIASCKPHRDRWVGSPSGACRDGTFQFDAQDTGSLILARITLKCSTHGEKISSELLLLPAQRLSHIAPQRVLGDIEAKTEQPISKLVVDTVAQEQNEADPKTLAFTTAAAETAESELRGCIDEFGQVVLQALFHWSRRRDTPANILMASAAVLKSWSSDQHSDNEYLN